MVKTILRGIIGYLKDWKNLAMHAMIGVGILLVAIFLPVAWYIRVLLLVLIVTFNILRMRHEREQKQTGDASSEKQP
ncbi:MAG: hypothetical protein HZC28_00860 [Spirochaetes bacterium]|nr:hypothetical protein [Spirochaetota bacterium]